MPRVCRSPSAAREEREMAKAMHYKVTNISTSSPIRSYTVNGPPDLHMLSNRIQESPVPFPTAQFTIGRLPYGYG